MMGWCTCHVHCWPSFQSLFCSFHFISFFMLLLLSIASVFIVWMYLIYFGDLCVFLDYDCSGIVCSVALNVCWQFLVTWCLCGEPCLRGEHLLFVAVYYLVSPITWMKLTSIDCWCLSLLMFCKLVYLFVSANKLLVCSVYSGCIRVHSFSC